MSGYSKFASIRHKKEHNDAAKGKVFTMIGREIAVTVKKGGADPANSSKLCDAITKAKTNNMSNDIIDRGTKRAVGDAASVNYEILTYEGYGPSGVAIIVDTLTDNKNCTVANVRSAFTKSGGNVGIPGSVLYMLDKKGQIIIDKEECEMDPDELIMTVLDTGAEDFAEEEDSHEATTASDDFSAMCKALEARNVPMMEASMTMIPQTWVELTDGEDIKKLDKTLDLPDEDDGAQAVHHNWDERLRNMEINGSIETG